MRLSGRRPEGRCHWRARSFAGRSPCSARLRPDDAVRPMRTRASDVSEVGAAGGERERPRPRRSPAGDRPADPVRSVPPTGHGLPLPHALGLKAAILARHLQQPPAALHHPQEGGRTFAKGGGPAASRGRPQATDRTRAAGRPRTAGRPRRSVIVACLPAVCSIAGAGDGAIEQDGPRRGRWTSPGEAGRQHCMQIGAVVYTRRVGRMGARVSVPHGSVLPCGSALDSRRLGHPSCIEAEDEPSRPVIDRKALDARRRLEHLTSMRPSSASPLPVRPRARLRTGGHGRGGEARPVRGLRAPMRIGLARIGPARIVPARIGPARGTGQGGCA